MAADHGHDARSPTKIKIEKKRFEETSSRWHGAHTTFLRMNMQETQKKTTAHLTRARSHVCEYEWMLDRCSISNLAKHTISIGLMYRQIPWTCILKWNCGRKTKEQKECADHRWPMSRLHCRSVMNFFGTDGMVIWPNLPLISDFARILAGYIAVWAGCHQQVKYKYCRKPIAINCFDGWWCLCLLVDDW